MKGTTLNAKGSGPSSMEGRASYGSGIADSPKYSSKDYVSTPSHGYGHKSELLIADKMTEYASLERRQFAERHGAYAGRELPIEAGGRYTDSVGYKVFFFPLIFYAYPLFFTGNLGAGLGVGVA